MNRIRLNPQQLDQMQTQAGAAAALLKALANEYRLLILCTLVPGELSVSQLNTRLPLAQSALSQHLSKLREHDLVTTRRDGLNVYYRLMDGPAARIIEVLYAAFCPPEVQP